MNVKVDGVLVMRYWVYSEKYSSKSTTLLWKGKFMNKINWKVRFNKENIMFIAQVVVSVVIPILTYFGLRASDLTTWSKVWETFIQAISNPYVVVMAIVSLFNSITDPTTKGIGDSTSALTYTKPKK